MIGSFGEFDQSCEYFKGRPRGPRSYWPFQYCHTTFWRRATDQARYCRAEAIFVVSIRTKKRGLPMLAIPRVEAFAALLVGVIAIATALWLELRRIDRRRRLARNVVSALSGENTYRAEETHFKRVA